MTWKNTSLDYWLNLENSTSWTSTSTLPEVQDTTKKDITTTITDTPENKEHLEIPKKLADFREKWEEEIILDDNPEKNAEKKRKIIDVVNRIQKGTPREEPDWSILVEFELPWWKKYKTLDVNLEKHSDSEYLTSCKYNRQTKNEVMLWWMMWDDTKNWDNKTLAEYVDKEKNDRNMEIRTVEFYRDLIDKLWDEAVLTDESDKIAMWMYLTWNYWYYWWTMWDYEKSNPKANSRSALEWPVSDRNFNYGDYDHDSASLCLIACE